jgi:hypothetical protein
MHAQAQTLMWDQAQRPGKFGCPIDIMLHASSTADEKERKSFWRIKGEPENTKADPESSA